MPNSNPQKSLYRQGMKFSLECARRRNERYDITKYPYEDPLHLIKKHEAFLTDEVLEKMQIVTKIYSQLHRTEKSVNVSDLLQKLGKDCKWYKYVLIFFKFIVGSFGSPFSLLTLDLLRPGNTFPEWISIERRATYNVRNGERKYKISYPSYPAPAPIYRFLQSATHVGPSYNLLHYCYQSQRHVSNTLHGYYLLSTLSISFSQIIIRLV